MRPWSGPRLTPARAMWVDAPARQADAAPRPGRVPPCGGGGAATGTGRPRVMPTRATCSAAPDRSWTERSWRPATGRTSTGHRRGDESRPCAALKFEAAERRGPTGAPERTPSAERPCRADLDRAWPWWMCSAATTTSTMDGGRPESDDGDDYGGDLPPPGAALPRPGPSSGRTLGGVGARFPGLAVLHRGERTAGVRRSLRGTRRRFTGDSDTGGYVRVPASDFQAGCAEGAICTVLCHRAPDYDLWLCTATGFPEMMVKAARCLGEYSLSDNARGRVAL